jgi:hypothetical protein
MRPALPPAQYSAAECELAGGRGSARGGTLKVTTSNTIGGWVRKNDVPYSVEAVITEYFDPFTAPDGVSWLTVTVIVTDSTYFNEPFVTTSHFKKEPDGSKWSPAPCRGIS